jgi:hypothetical protein
MEGDQESTMLSPGDCEGPALERMAYCGSSKRYYGAIALCRPHPVLQDCVLAQFEDAKLDPYRAWHLLSQSLFRPLGSTNLPQPSPYASAGIGVSDLPPTPVPTKPARKVHRLGRLFDDAPKRTPVNHGPAPASMMRVMDGEQWSAAASLRGEEEK